MTPESLEHAASGAGTPTEPSALVLLETLLRNWRYIAGFTICVGLATGALSLLLPPTYEATLSFFPQAKGGTRLPSSLASIAGQFGVSVGEEPTQSSQFYASLLGSRATLRPLLFAKYANPDPAEAVDSLALIDIYRTKGRTAAQRTENGLRELGQSVDASVDALTGVVTVHVAAKDPILAAAIARRLFEQLNVFNILARQEQARKRREYAQRVSADAEAALHKAEGTLEQFYARNREYQSSPGLRFEEQRLHRQVDMAQELYLNLMRQYQAAEVEEANDVPVLVLIDEPVAPTKRSKPRRRILVLVGMFLGFTTISAVMVISEYRRRASAEDTQRWRLVVDAWRAMKADVRRLLRLRS